MIMDSIPIFVWVCVGLVVLAIAALCSILLLLSQELPDSFDLDGWDPTSNTKDLDNWTRYFKSKQLEREAILVRQNAAEVTSVTSMLKPPAWPISKRRKANKPCDLPPPMVD